MAQIVHGVGRKRPVVACASIQPHVLIYHWHIANDLQKELDNIWKAVSIKEVK